MFRTCYTTVSDLAVCQRCPALFGYKLHMHEKDAWRIGIHGNGNAYGSMFHKNIARVFFEAASNPSSPLHAQAVRAVSGGFSELEEFIRENIFMPFVAAHSDEYTPGQLMAAAKGVKVWVRAMADFFAEIPSLRANPARNMSIIFLEPEQKLRGHYDFPNEGRLVVTGCYDALLFNPDKAEARLFEFKGYAKSDLAVPLSQSLLYAWLIWSFSGVVPSVEVIYLDEEDRKPDVFDPASVKAMMRAGLPGLFYAAFNTITLRRLPEIMRDKNLCRVCKFREGCASDWSGKFRKRQGASLVNVLVFFIAATMITTQVFFFSTLSAENTSVQAHTIQQRLIMNMRLDRALTALESHDLPSLDHNVLDPEELEAAYANPKIVNVAHGLLVRRQSFDRTTNALLWEDDAHTKPLLYTATVLDGYKSFDKVAKVWSADNGLINVYDLNYTLMHNNGFYPKIEEPDKGSWHLVPVPQRIFPPKKPESGTYYFLVRVLTPTETGRKTLMYQMLAGRTKRPDTDFDRTRTHFYDVKPLSFQEVWF